MPLRVPCAVPFARKRRRSRASHVRAARSPFGSFRAYYAAFFARRGHPPAERQRAGSQPKPRTARLGFDDSLTLRRPAARDARQTPVRVHPIASAICSTPPPPIFAARSNARKRNIVPTAACETVHRSVNSVEIAHTHAFAGRERRPCSTARHPSHDTRATPAGNRAP